MREVTREEQFINNMLQGKNGISKNTLEFYHELMDLFKSFMPLVSSSKKLAERYNRSERSIQRYVKALEEIGLIHVRHIWNNDNPDKPYIVENHYSPTVYSMELHEKAKNYVRKDRNVEFRHKATA